MTYPYIVEGLAPKFLLTDDANDTELVPMRITVDYVQPDHRHKKDSSTQ